MNERDISVEEIDKMVSSYIQTKRPAGVFATSLGIAAAVKKDHHDVLRVISNIIDAANKSESGVVEEDLFTEMFYKDSNGREQKMIAMTEEGFMAVFAEYIIELRYGKKLI